MFNLTLASSRGGQCQQAAKAFSKLLIELAYVHTEIYKFHAANNATLYFCGWG